MEDALNPSTRRVSVIGNGLSVTDHTDYKYSHTNTGSGLAMGTSLTSALRHFPKFCPQLV
jgi:hypothetical protein